MADGDAFLGVAGLRVVEHTAASFQEQRRGGIEYMSPEQAEMTGLDVDTRTDLWAARSWRDLPTIRARGRGGVV